jgi:tetratricopeptide (TPR) repeat protein
MLYLNPAVIYSADMHLMCGEWDLNSEMCTYLSFNENPAAIQFLSKASETNPDIIDWLGLSGNPAAIHMINNELKQTPNRINWTYLSKNPAAIYIIDNELKQTPTRIDRSMFMNPAAIHHIHYKIIKYSLDNHNNYKLISKEEIESYWEYLSENPAVIHLIHKALEADPNDNKINWKRLSANPEAIHLLIELIKDNPDDNKIHWIWLSRNPAIFTYDYDKIRHDRLLVKKGIIENRFHPKNIKYFKGWGFEDFDEFEE